MSEPLSVLSPPAPVPVRAAERLRSIRREDARFRSPLAPGTLVFDTARADDGAGRSFVLTAPREVLAAWTPEAVVPVLAAATRALDAGFWVGGMVAYEAGAAWMDGSGALETAEAAESDSAAAQRFAAIPLVWFGIYDAPRDVPTWPPPAWPEPAEPPTWTPSLGADDYTARHERVRALIHEGDVYQVNLTFALTAPQAMPLAALYAALRQRQPVPYGAFLSLTGPEGTSEGDGGIELASLSPELFFRVEPRPDGGRRIVTRPMKGTVRRGDTAGEDADLRRDLAADPKNRAENLMIVDLLRNDLSVVCVPGSVAVPALFETEVHPTLSQMTSTVEGRLRDDVRLADLFGALFPSGSITGAPKRRAMARIADLEDGPRGAYCGAIGYAAPSGEMAFSVAIRTVTAREGVLTAGVGSGVTYDSDAADEYRECLLKAAFLGPVLDAAGGESPADGALARGATEPVTP